MGSLGKFDHQLWLLTLQAVCTVQMLAQHAIVHCIARTGRKFEGLFEFRIWVNLAFNAASRV
jgi:hypothetical protein